MIMYMPVSKKIPERVWEIGWEYTGIVQKAMFLKQFYTGTRDHPPG
jgi:hypothetical protein